MSHFSVLIIGENPEKQLAPFNEGLEVEEYTDEEGKKSTYNPNSKWDWYQLGGRFRGMLMPKIGKSGDFYGDWGKPGVGDNERLHDGWGIDTSIVEEIDWEKTLAIDEKELANAEIFWEKYVEYCSSSEFEVLSEGDKKRYVDDLEKELDTFFMYSASYWKDRYHDFNTYVKAHLGFGTWAVIKDGKWYEKGEMGWWGLSDETHAEALDWDLSFYDRFIKDLPGDTIISIYDCHI